MTRKVEWRNLIFYGFIIVYSISLIFLSFKLNISIDEAYSLHTTSNNLATVIKQAYDFEGQPPFYFLLLAIWRHVNSGIFFARLLSLVFIGFSGYFFLRLVRLVSGRESSRWMLVIFLLNPFTVWAGLEIRLYALAIFLSIILIYYFFRFYIENKNKHLYLFLIISLIGLYTQYFFILEISALAFSLLVFKGWKIFFKFCLYLLPLLVLFIPNLFFMHQQVDMLQSHKVEYSTINRISAVLHSPQDLMLALQMVPFNLGIRLGIRIIFILITIYAYFKVYKKQPIVSDSYFGKINVILLSVSVLIFLYSVLIAITGIFFQFRYMAIVFPLFILVFTLFKVYSSINRNLIYAIISIYYISLLILNYKHPIKHYDFKTVGKFVNKIEHSKEPVLFYGKALLPPFTYYYTGPNLLVPLPALKFDHNYYEENINDTLELKKAIEKINSPTKSYILMTANFEGNKYTINMNQQMIDECLKTNYNVTLDTSFLGKDKNLTLRIRRLEIKKTNNFP
jgi:hypothetical protein